MKPATQRTETLVKLGLGICARDEEAGIATTLSSLVNSANAIPGRLEWELVICANGCSDSTTDIIAQWISGNSTHAVSLALLDNGNLVEAQRLVATSLKSRGADLIAFFDADIEVDIACIPELLKIASSDAVKAAYAVSVPVKRIRPTLVEKALNQYDSSTEVFSARRHLHGRAFLIKEWSIPSTSPQLAADDIYLSCDLLYRFGPEAIAAAPNAKVYFHQVSSLSDYYAAYKRRSLELSKCLQLFPHFETLPKEQLNRQVCWNKLLNQPLSNAFFWILLLAVRKYFQILLFVELTVRARRSTEWEVTSTSKQSFEATPRNGS